MSVRIQAWPTGWYSREHWLARIDVTSVVEEDDALFVAKPQCTTYASVNYPRGFEFRTGSFSEQSRFLFAKGRLSYSSSDSVASTEVKGIASFESALKYVVEQLDLAELWLAHLYGIGWDGTRDANGFMYRFERKERRRVSDVFILNRESDGRRESIEIWQMVSSKMLHRIVRRWKFKDASRSLTLRTTVDILVF